MSKLLKSLNVKDYAFAGARINKKTGEFEKLSQFENSCLFGENSKSDCSDCQFNLPVNPSFHHFGLMLDNKIEYRDSGWRVTQRTSFCDTG
ncbi:hypothetical protein HC248_01570 [Polaromonas vacuolata]|uniref:Uncharacterized protein n=1 Tax=Polaromonas vacuolata TaxID=37448 RepID=A0A6H2H8R9_9BURK|nr:hypothetical protein HC248_01570 [Polaromonas vacuolata]